MFGLVPPVSAQELVLPSREGTLHIRALSPDIVRVTVSPTDRVPLSSVPIVVGSFPSPKVSVVRSKGVVEYRTTHLHVQVDRTGAVSFLDNRDHLLCSEARGSQMLQLFSLPGFSSDPAYHVATSFNLGADDRLYGLGQHQDGALDRRGVQTILSQTNREVAIPWAISNRGYGILWNNASRTIVNASGPADMRELSDDQGKSGGLTGTYFEGTKFEKAVNVRRDTAIDFDWTNIPPPKLGKENYSVRWTGSFTPSRTGEYRFRTTADDGVRLFIDGKKVIDDWSVHAARDSDGVVEVTARSHHSFRLEFFQASRDSIVKLGWTNPGSGQVSWNSYAAHGIDYYFVYGGSVATTMADYRQLTGPAPMPPKWALGYWQSKERYNTQKEWGEIAEGYRSRHLPIDNLVQDWFYWDPHAWGSHRFDAKRYPDPAAGIKELHDRYHLHLMISVWGKFAPGSDADPDDNYRQLLEHKALYPESVSSPERYYDAFSAEARSLYWNQVRQELFSKGIDAWWLDASEPEANLKALDETPTGLGPGAFVVSGWPLMHTAGVYEGQRSADKAKRVFILTRSAFAGQQRNGAATWSGDITASWDTLAKQIPAGLNIAMSGIPYWTTDIGAFFVPYPKGCDNPEYRELYTRWFEFGAFCPIFRSHGTDTPREMWRFGPEVQAILAKYDRLRYQLLPYIYSESWQATSNGSTEMRPLVWDFQADDQAAKIKDEFMFGPDLLICPVVTPKTSKRKVYLPAGTQWFDFWTGASFAGGEWIDASAPLDREPIYVRGGSILPLGPAVEYSSQKAADPIELRLYPGGKSKFVLYEDTGDGYGYEQGQRAEIPLAWDGHRLSIGVRKGSFPGMLRSRTFRVAVSGGQQKVVAYRGKATTVQVW